MYKTLENTLFIGKKVIYVPSCPSTNDLALKLLHHQVLPEGTVIITNKQTEGRGQRGNKWLTEPGLNLTLSVILRPTFLAIKDQFYLTIVTALAVRDFINTQAEIVAQIKWPNDILINNKKAGGILIENQLQGEYISTTVVGIGLNVNQKNFELLSATSIRLEMNREFVLSEIFTDLLSNLESRYLTLRSGDLSSLKKDYLNSLFRLNEQHTYISNNIQFTGVIRDIDAWGKLLIETEKGIKRFDLKEVSFL